MIRRTNTKKNGGKKIAKKNIQASRKPRDFRFDLSLVILIGMLTFSSMLFLVSLNRSLALEKKAPQTYRPTALASQMKKSQDQILNDSSLDFTLTVPAQVGDWSYKIGQVQSLTDNSLSNQYLRIYIPFPGKKSKDIDDQYKDILTIRKMTSEEWADVQDDCEKEKNTVCGLAGKKIDPQTDAADINEKYIYTHTIASDCPGSIVARCSLANEIVKSFSLK